MKTFKYGAMDAQGKEKRGTIEAANAQEANTKLKDQGLFPTSINPEKPPKKNKYQQDRPAETEVKTKVWLDITIFGFHILIERIIK